VPARLRDAAPDNVGESAALLVETERVLASVVEAVIGACNLTFGYDRTAEAVVEAFGPEIKEALEHPVDFKSTLQERLAQHGETVVYEVIAEHGPPHDRTFDIEASAGERIIGTGSGRSKKAAEQQAARAALDGLDGDEAERSVEAV